MNGLSLDCQTWYTYLTWKQRDVICFQGQGHSLNKVILWTWLLYLVNIIQAKLLKVWPPNLVHILLIWHYNFYYAASVTNRTNLLSQHWAGSHYYCDWNNYSCICIAKVNINYTLVAHSLSVKLPLWIFDLKIIYGSTNQMAVYFLCNRAPHFLHIKSLSGALYTDLTKSFIIPAQPVAEGI